MQYMRFEKLQAGFEGFKAAMKGERPPSEIESEREQVKTFVRNIRDLYLENEKLDPVFREKNIGEGVKEIETLLEKGDTARALLKVEGLQEEIDLELASS